jgi:hypothetical protein
MNFFSFFSFSFFVKVSLPSIVGYQFHSVLNIKKKKSQLTCLSFCRKHRRGFVGAPSSQQQKTQNDKN